MSQNDTLKRKILLALSVVGLPNSFALWKLSSFFLSLVENVMICQAKTHPLDLSTCSEVSPPYDSRYDMSG